MEGQEVYESAPNGSKIPLGNSKITPAQNGHDYQLTLDSELQWVAQRRVAQQVAKTKADFGFAITMNIKTGEVLALAQAPSVRLERPAEAIEEVPQPAGGDGSVRARQRAEDPHLGGADRLRHGRREHPAGGSRTG